MLGLLNMHTQNLHHAETICIYYLNVIQHMYHTRVCEWSETSDVFCVLFLLHAFFEPRLFHNQLKLTRPNRWSFVLRGNEKSSTKNIMQLTINETGSQKQHNARVVWNSEILSAFVACVSNV